VAQGPVAEIVGGMSQPGPVRVRTPHADQLVLELTKQGARVDYPPDGALLVSGVDAAAVGRAALAAQAELHELVSEKPDLEQVFLELTHAKAGIR
jgi:ABC-2 type transport system ATP-binding protein